MSKRKLDPYTLRTLARRYKARGKAILARLASAANSNAYSTGRALELDMQGDNLRGEARSLESATRKKAAK